VTTFLDDTVVNGVTCHYRVSALNAVGEGNLTDSEHATPTAEGGIDDDDEGDDNTLLYLIIAAVIVAAVAGLAFFFLRKRK
jgi:LPXTG-motif cell wall-anchored protein